MSYAWTLGSLGTRLCIMQASPSATCAPPSCARFRPPLCPGIRKNCVGRCERLQVVCMAHPRRVARVASQIQREVGDLFVYDPVIQAAICPERKGGGDTLSAVASITNTYVSNDLQVVKVYISVYSDDYGKRVAMQNLVRLEPYVRRLIGQRVRLRRTPEVRFVYDDSEEEADLVVRVIGREEVERYRTEIESELVPGARPALAAEAHELQGGGEDEGGAEEDEEGEEDEYDEVDDDPDELPQEYPNPFGDLFGDVGDDDSVLLGERRQAGRGRGGKGKGGRGRGGRGSRPAAQQKQAGQQKQNEGTQTESDAAGAGAPREIPEVQ